MASGYYGRLNISLGIIFPCLYVCINLRCEVCVYVCMYVCMRACITLYICMYVCMYVSEMCVLPLPDGIMEVLLRALLGGMNESWIFSVANWSFLAPAISKFNHTYILTYLKGIGKRFSRFEWMNEWMNECMCSYLKDGSNSARVHGDLTWPSSIVGGSSTWHIHPQIPDSIHTSYQSSILHTYIHTYIQYIHTHTVVKYSTYPDNVFQRL